VISDDELARMCWFVEGVVEKSDPSDPGSADRPAHVPDGLHGSYPPSDDVQAFMAEYPFIDPERDMNCPMNQ